LERIFIDKVFAAEHHFRRNELRDTSKHIYDLIIMEELDEINQLLIDPKKIEPIITIERQESRKRSNSDLAEVKISDFSYMHNFGSTPIQIREFQDMQRLYVYDDHYQVGEEALRKGLKRLVEYFRGR
jgi:hypothetical protein